VADGTSAAVPGVAGTWKGPADNVNFITSNLTGLGANHDQGIEFAPDSPLEGDGFELSGRIGRTSKTAGFIA
jgi:hypothetical protein